MDRAADLALNCAVRRILVRHWIDLGRITVRAIQGVVTVSGTLVRLPAAGSPLSGTIVSAILSEIRRLANVQRVRTNLANWELGADGYKETTPQTTTAQDSSTRAPSIG